MLGQQHQDAQRVARCGRVELADLPSAWRGPSAAAPGVNAIITGLSAFCAASPISRRARGEERHRGEDQRGHRRRRDRSEEEPRDIARDLHFLRRASPEIDGVVRLGRQQQLVQRAHGCPGSSAARRSPSSVSDRTRCRCHRPRRRSRQRRHAAPCDGGPGNALRAPCRRDRGPAPRLLAAHRLEDLRRLRRGSRCASAPTARRARCARSSPPAPACRRGERRRGRGEAPVNGSPSTQNAEGLGAARPRRGTSQEVADLEIHLIAERDAVAEADAVGGGAVEDETIKALLWHERCPIGTVAGAGRCRGPRTSRARRRW